MDKSPDAFRTISEVADALETPAHVLRFWESRFPQIKPVKRAGGRRYYRPADVALLSGIRHLLHDEGMTIRGVQKILREQGVRHVAALAPGSNMADFDVTDDDDDLVLDLSVSGEEPATTGQIVAMEMVGRRVTLTPDEPAEVVQLHTAADAIIPDISEGFLLPTANRRPLPTLDEPLADGVPEAAHVWVELADEPAQVAPLFPVEAAARDLDDLAGPAPPELARTTASQPLDLVPEAVPQDLGQPSAAEGAPELSDADAAAGFGGLAGIASRLRALPGPLRPNSVEALSALQMRLGQLQAQMVAATRARR